MTQEQDLAMAYLIAEPSDKPKYEKQLADLYRRMESGEYEFKSDPAKRVARHVFEEEEKTKAKVRGLKKTVMSELEAVPIPGAPAYEEAKARFERRGPGGRRTAIRKRKSRKTRKSRK